MIRRRLAIPLAVLLIGAALSGAAYEASRRAADARLLEKFHAKNHEVRDRILDRLSHYIDALYGAQGLFAASQSVERDEWTAYVRQQNVKGRYPGIESFAYLERVPRDKKDAFPIQIYPPGERNEYVVVKYSESTTETEPEVGFDFFSEPVRRQALELARDTGTPIATDRLARPAGNDAEFRIFLPIYSNGAPVSNTEERRAALQGYVAAGFKTRDLLSIVYGELVALSMVDLEIFDGDGVSKENLLYDNYNRLDFVGASAPPRFSTISKIDVAGHRWTLKAETMPGFEKGARAPAWITLGAGAFATLVLAGLALALVRSRERAVEEALAARRLMARREEELAHASAARPALASSRSPSGTWVSQAESLFAALAPARTASDVVARSLESLADRGGWDVAAAWLVDADGRTLSCAAFWTRAGVAAPGFETASRNRVFTPGVGLPGRAWESRSARWLDRLTEDSNLPRAQIAVKEGISCGYAFPIFCDGAVTGVFEFFSRELRAADESVLTAAPAIGRWIGHEIRRREAEQTLRTKTEESARLGRELEQFTQAAAHDLQEPLARLEADVEALSEEKAIKGRTARAVDNVLEAARRLRRLLSDLVAYSRATRAELSLEPINAAETMNEALERLAREIRSRGAFVTYDPLPTVMADAPALERLFENLIQNSVRYSGKNPPRVHVSARRDNEQWVFSVRDNGAGIDPAQLEQIFLLFRRLSDTDEEGTGMGLAISKKIVERHGGRLWAESEPGKGSTFFFTIPVR